MSVPPVPALASGKAQAITSDTRLRGRWLVMARVAWVLLVACTLALFFASLPAYDARLQTPCVGAVACNLNGTLTATGMRTLQAAGFSLSGYAGYTVALNIIGVLIWSAVGMIIFWRRSDDWLALLVALALVLFNAGQQSAAPTALALTYPAWAVPVEVVNVLSVAIYGFFILVFPGGRFAPHWTIWIGVLNLVQTALAAFPPADSPLNTANWPLVVNGLIFISIIVGGLFSQIYRYRRLASPVQRQQVKWAVFGIIVTAVCIIALSLSAFIPAFNQPGSLYEPVINTLYPLALLPIPLSIGVAILRYRLWDIDAIINKALVYGLLTGLLGALYAGLIIGLTGMAGVFTGITNQPVVLVISTLAIAALFTPARNRIQAIIDRRFYRRKYDAEKTLAAFSAALRNEVDLHELREHLLAVVQETMQPTHASLWLRTPEPRQASLDGEAYA
ncbi:MAG TPA: hypothetical protein VKT82_16885 [Ktedonobacterales bacterium]|nr:hypothetical protein [Ktedonobacterales bacterium]